MSRSIGIGTYFDKAYLLKNPSRLSHHSLNIDFFILLLLVLPMWMSWWVVRRVVHF